MARRKQYKKAEYESYPNCHHYEEATAGRWQEIFGKPQPLTVELGCGHGTFSLELARRYPERNFLGVDLKATRMYRAAKMAQEEGISNLAFLCQNLRLIANSVAKNEADELWVTFPDPFPKKRQAKHRTINPAFLQQYRQIVKPGGSLHYKTDNAELFQYSLEVFVREPYIRLEELSFDLHETAHIPDDYKILTEYERQFLDMGKAIQYVRLRLE